MPVHYLTLRFSQTCDFLGFIIYSASLEHAGNPKPAFPSVPGSILKKGHVLASSANLIALHCIDKFWDTTIIMAVSRNILLALERCCILSPSEVGLQLPSALSKIML
uniref:Uncharacterized protein n=2 Tax=Micrurus TaxID=8634 RepID=A0A2D4F9L8_MICCO